MRLDLYPGRYAVWRLPAGSPIPDLPRAPGQVIALAATDDEVSVVGPEGLAPAAGPVEAGFRVLGVRGPLEFSLVGVIASLAEPLASAGVSVFVFSTFETDYVLVRESDLETAVAALRADGHDVSSDAV
jgi:hypothetical protein